MICQPCRDGVHTGDGEWRQAYLDLAALLGTKWPIQLCSGGTWCDCQHRHGAATASLWMPKS